MMTGNELCVGIFDALLRRLGEREQFDLGQKSAALFGKLMPPWYAATLLLSTTVVYRLRSSGTAALAGSAALLFLLAIVFTATLLVPINSRIAGWTWDTRPKGWRQARQTWDTRHTVRVSLLFIALACLILACLLPH